MIPREREMMLSVLKRGLSEEAVLAKRAYSEMGRLEPAMAEPGLWDFKWGSVTVIGFVFHFYQNNNLLH